MKRAALLILLATACSDELYLTGRAPTAPAPRNEPTPLDAGVLPEADAGMAPEIDAGVVPEVDSGTIPEVDGGVFADAATPLCTIGDSRPCYTGLPATRGTGICRDGSETCIAAPGGARWDSCLDDVLPRQEICGNARDDDCDGVIDQSCTCLAGNTRACYPGPAGEIGVGICAEGTQQCLRDGSGWTACSGASTPVAEICDDGQDNDCNGDQDEGCVCQAGAQRPCFRWPSRLNGVGICRAGTQQCRADGLDWASCRGEVGPSAEICGNGIDEDCDGGDDQCAPVEVPLYLIGDCVTAMCPASTPYPVGCNVLFSPGDRRGCVASVPTSRAVFFKAGNRCDAGLVLGSLFCSDTPGAPLGPTNCPINKPDPRWVTDRRQCPQ